MFSAKLATSLPQLAGHASSLSHTIQPVIQQYLTADPKKAEPIPDGRRGMTVVKDVMTNFTMTGSTSYVLLVNFNCVNGAIRRGLRVTHPVIAGVYGFGLLSIPAPNEDISLSYIEARPLAAQLECFASTVPTGGVAFDGLITAGMIKTPGMFGAIDPQAVTTYDPNSIVQGSLYEGVSILRYPVGNNNFAIPGSSNTTVGPDYAGSNLVRSYVIGASPTGPFRIGNAVATVAGTVLFSTCASGDSAANLYLTGASKAIRVGFNIHRFGATTGTQTYCVWTSYYINSAGAYVADQTFTIFGGAPVTGNLGGDQSGSILFQGTNPIQQIVCTIGDSGAGAVSQAQVQIEEIDIQGMGSTHVIYVNGVSATMNVVVNARQLFEAVPQDSLAKQLDGLSLDAVDITRFSAWKSSVEVMLAHPELFCMTIPERRKFTESILMPGSVPALTPTDVESGRASGVFDFLGSIADPILNGAKGALTGAIQGGLAGLMGRSAGVVHHQREKNREFWAAAEHDDTRRSAVLALVRAITHFAQGSAEEFEAFDAACAQLRQLPTEALLQMAAEASPSISGTASSIRTFRHDPLEVLVYAPKTDITPEFQQALFTDEKVNVYWSYMAGSEILVGRDSQISRLREDAPGVEWTPMQSNAFEVSEGKYQQRRRGRFVGQPAPAMVRPNAVRDDGWEFDVESKSDGLVGIAGGVSGKASGRAPEADHNGFYSLDDVDWVSQHSIHFKENEVAVQISSGAKGPHPGLEVRVRVHLINLTSGRKKRATIRFRFGRPRQVNFQSSGTFLTRRLMVSAPSGSVSAPAGELGDWPFLVHADSIMVKIKPDDERYAITRVDRAPVVSVRVAPFMCECLKKETDEGADPDESDWQFLVRVQDRLERARGTCAHRNRARTWERSMQVVAQTDADPTPTTSTPNLSGRSSGELSVREQLLAMQEQIARLQGQLAEAKAAAPAAKKANPTDSVVTIAELADAQAKPAALSRWGGLGTKGKKISAVWFPLVTGESKAVPSIIYVTNKPVSNLTYRQMEGELYFAMHPAKPEQLQVPVEQDQAVYASVLATCRLTSKYTGPYYVTIAYIYDSALTFNIEVQEHSCTLALALAANGATGKIMATGIVSPQTFTISPVAEMAAKVPMLKKAAAINKYKVLIPAQNAQDWGAAGDVAVNAGMTGIKATLKFLTGGELFGVNIVNSVLEALVFAEKGYDPDAFRDVQLSAPEMAEIAKLHPQNQPAAEAAAKRKKANMARQEAEAKPQTAYLEPNEFPEDKPAPVNYPTSAVLIGALRGWTNEEKTPPELNATNLPNFREIRTSLWNALVHEKWPRSADELRNAPRWGNILRKAAQLYMAVHKAAPKKSGKGEARVRNLLASNALAFREDD